MNVYSKVTVFKVVEGIMLQHLLRITYMYMRMHIVTTY